MKGVIETGTILDKIVAKKIEEVERRRKEEPPLVHSSSHSRPFRAGFFEALTGPSRHGRPIIAEIKKASPSTGVLREPFQPEFIARLYQTNGARCISVITDEEFFQGSLSVLRKVRETVRIPILRKDFIIDDIQIEDTVRAGADAMLLIERILEPGLMADLYSHAVSHDLAVLVEVHDEKGMERVLSMSSRPKLIGVNNRDLSDFSVNLSRTTKLLPLVPEDVTLVSESGLSNVKVLDDLLEAGVSAFLIGTALMKANDMGEELKRLVFGKDN